MYEQDIVDMTVEEFLEAQRKLHELKTGQYGMTFKKKDRKGNNAKRKKKR